MIMRSEVIELREVTRLEQMVVSASTTCNKCGERVLQPSLRERKGREGKPVWMQSFECSFGYGSRYDNEKWSFDLCEDCLLELIRTFKYVPEGFRGGGFNLVDGAKYQKIFEHWQKTGQWEPFKFHSYEELLEFQKFFNEDYFQALITTYYPEKKEQHHRKAAALGEMARTERPCF